MLASRNHFWVQQIAPNLPSQYWEEYLALLRAYAPSAVPTLVMPCEKGTWCFPFIDIPSDFDHQEYEEWVTMVEADIAQRHDLPLTVFES